MKKSFLNKDKPMITSMVLANTLERTKYLIKESDKQGADAFGIQFDKLKNEYCTESVYRELVEFAGEKPLYVTSYRTSENAGKTDEELEKEIIQLSKCGATLCDIMGDYYDPQPNEFTTNPKAVEKQKKLIDTLHKNGAEVLMSCHILNFTPAEEILKIALEQQSRGVDICKIVTGANTMEQQIENIRILTLLKEAMDIPFLFLSGGESRIMRRVGCALGNCMFLAVCEHDDLAVATQPLVKDAVILRNII